MSELTGQVKEGRKKGGIDDDWFLPSCCKVLVVGGTGGMAREVAKHSCVEEIQLCEIDEVRDAPFPLEPLSHARSCNITCKKYEMC